MKVSETIEGMLEAGMLDYEYAEYIMEHCSGDRIICNRDTLIAAMESHYLADDFISTMISIMESNNND